jgi:hypothetical protein
MVSIAEKPGEQIEKTDESVSRGTGTILLVDDEKMVLDVGEEMLQETTCPSQP